jgi:arylsulfatase A-like enzyme
VLSNVWDNHGGTGALGGVSGYEMLKAHYCIPPLDRGLSALLADLDDRGLLDETLVVAMGEMGRTPRINKTAGRDHWGAAQSVLLAGGGVRGGQVYGATDQQAAYVKDNPVRPEDLLATVYHALGIDPDSEIPDREGRPVRITEGRPVTALFG